MLLPLSINRAEPDKPQGRGYVVRETTREVIVAKETIRTIELVDGSFIVEIEEIKEVSNGR